MEVAGRKDDRSIQLLDQKEVRSCRVRRQLDPLKGERKVNGKNLINRTLDCPISRYNMTKHTGIQAVLPETSVSFNSVPRYTKKASSRRVHDSEDEGTQALNATS